MEGKEESLTEGAGAAAVVEAVAQPTQVLRPIIPGVKLFGKYNFRVSTAADLGTARRKAEELAPDIVMCDKNIGGHRGVVPFLDYMQREKPETPLVLCSAEDGARARVELYCHEFISKVLPFEKIHAGVNHVLSDFGISPPRPGET